MDEQRPVIPIAVNDVPHAGAIGFIVVVLGVKLGIDVVPLEGVLFLYQWSGVSVGNFHGIPPF
jgi:hypothetical protein